MRHERVTRETQERRDTAETPTHTDIETCGGSDSNQNMFCPHLHTSTHTTTTIHPSGHSADTFLTSPFSCLSLMSLSHVSLSCIPHLVAELPATYCPPHDSCTAHRSAAEERGSEAKRGSGGRLGVRLGRRLGRRLRGMKEEKSDSGESVCRVDDSGVRNKG